MIVLAGPSHQFNPQAYSQFLDATSVDPRFNAGEMMAAIAKLTKLSWVDSAMYRFVLIPAVKRGLQQHKERFAWMSSRPAWGKGRIDPQNPFKFTTLEQPIDSTIGNADMPPLWNMKARRGMALHWDGMNTVYREVLLSSGLGNGATVKSLEVENIDRLGAWFDDLQPPKFPFPIDAALAEQGRRVFDATCASCHAAGGARTGQVIPIEEVGTDRHRLDTWTAPSAEAFNALDQEPAVAVHALQEDQRHGGQPARRHLVASAVSAQRIGSLAHRPAGAGRAAPRAVLSRIRRLRSGPGRLRVVRAGGGAGRVRVRRDAAGQWQRGARVRRRALARSEARARGVHEDAVRT